MSISFCSERVSQHITRIFGFCSELMYLIEGSHEAILIDTGCGVGSLATYVHTLTEKPVRVLLSHGHLDHAMGSTEFEKVHLSPLDMEAALDKLIMDELKNTKVLYQQNWDALEQLIAQWTPKAELTGAQIIKLEKKICCLEDETEAILMERIRDRANAERYDRMIQKREEEIAAAKKQIEELQNISAVLRERQTKLKRDIGMIDDILAEGAMTEAHLRMLVEKIYVQETDGKLSLDIQIKAPFRTHLDVYENGTLTERYGALDFDWNRLARLLYGDGLAG